MPSLLNLIPNAVGQGQAVLVYAEVTGPLPSNPTEPLYLVFTDWSVDYPYAFTNWPSVHGGTMPTIGDAALVVVDNRGQARCVWWDGEFGPLNSTGQNVLWVAPGGNSSYPGTSTFPLDSVETAIKLLSGNGSFLVGKWQIQVMAGTFSGAAAQATIDYTARTFRTFYPLQIYGPNVGPQLPAPSGFARAFSGSGSSFAGGTQFFWGATAKNGNGETLISNVVSGTPSAGQNAVLTCTAVVPPTSQVNSSQPAVTQTLTGYNWYRSTTLLGLNTTPAFIGTSATPTFTDTGAAASAGAAPPVNTTGSQPTAIFDGTSAANGTAGLTLFGDMNVWLANLCFQNFQGSNASPSRGVYSGSMNSGNLRIEDCCAQLCDFGVDALNAQINVFGNSQFLNNTTNQWGFGLETKNSGWVDIASTARGKTIVQGNLIGIYTSEASDSHPVAAYIDNNGVGVHVSRCTRFETDGLSLSRNTIGVQGHLVAAIEDNDAIWWDGTSWANTQKYDLGMYAAQADSGFSYGRSERYRCIDATGYTLTGTTSAVKMWDSNGGANGTGVSPTTSQPPDPWQCQANFLNVMGHRLTIKVYVAVTGGAGTKAVELKIGGQFVDNYTFSSATTGGGWVEFIVAPTGAANSNTQMVWHNAYVNANSNIPSQSSGTITLGGIANTGPQSIQLFGQLGNSADSLSYSLIEVSEV